MIGAPPPVAAAVARATPAASPAAVPGEPAPAATGCEAPAGLTPDAVTLGRAPVDAHVGVQFAVALRSTGDSGDPWVFLAPKDGGTQASAIRFDGMVSLQDDELDAAVAPPARRGRAPVLMAGGADSQLFLFTPLRPGPATLAFGRGALARARDPSMTVPVSVVAAVPAC